LESGAFNGDFTRPADLDIHKISDPNVGGDSCIGEREHPVMCEAGVSDADVRVGKESGGIGSERNRVDICLQANVTGHVNQPCVCERKEQIRIARANLSAHVVQDKPIGASSNANGGDRKVLDFY
jgi:hypothetical protein